MAVTAELVDYIKKSLAAGRTLYEVKYDLVNEGWDELDVDQALREVQTARQAFQQPQTQYAQPWQPQQMPQYQQGVQQPTTPYAQPQQAVQPHVEGGKTPILGFIFSIMAALTLLLDAVMLKSRGWVDIFSSLTVVDTSEVGLGLMVLILVFTAGICLGGLLSMKRSAVAGGLLVILLSFISMLTFAGLLSGLVGMVAGVVVFLKK